MRQFYRPDVLFTLVFSLVVGLLPGALQADVVKPALVEISVDTEGEVNIEVRASIEALLTGINGRYKNTQDAPNADAYDALRVLEPENLHPEFDRFRDRFLTQIRLTDEQGRTVPLAISQVDIPEPGYTKVPRISLIKLSGKLDVSAKAVQWYYPLAFGDNAVRLKQVDEANQQWHWSEWQWIRKDEASQPFSLTEIVTHRPWHQVFSEYVVIGFDHIIPKGLDHILFILALFFFSTQMRPLFWQVTMFTVAHTITLGLSINGVINLPANIVEPLIALSIAYAGFENVFVRKLHNSRLLLVFLFGLLHGMGFASVLNDFGMPDNAFITALIGFNVGVEIGQLAVIALAFFGLPFWFKNKPWYRNVIVIPVSLAIALTGLYWAVERIQF